MKQKLYVEADTQNQPVKAGDQLAILSGSRNKEPETLKVAICAADDSEGSIYLYEVHSPNGSVFYHDGFEFFDPYTTYKRAEDGSYIAAKGPKTLKLEFEKAGNAAVLSISNAQGQLASRRRFILNPGK